MDISAFYKISYGLYIVSSGKDEEKNGYIANTVFQVTAEPPQFAISCNKDNLTAAIISKSGYFSVSVLEKETPASLMGLFGFQSGKTANKFKQTEHITTGNGTPVVTQASVAWFECKVTQKVDVGTHILFIGEILDAKLLDEAKEPLTYAWYREVKKGVAPKNAPTHIQENVSEKNAKPGMKKYKCLVCGHIYDPAEGDPDAGIPPGTPFSDLPDAWQCPVCGVSKDNFEVLDEN